MRMVGTLRIRNCTRMMTLARDYEKRVQMISGHGWTRGRKTASVSSRNCTRFIALARFYEKRVQRVHACPLLVPTRRHRTDIASNVSSRVHSIWYEDNAADQGL